MTTHFFADLSPVMLPLSKASFSLFNTSADVGPCFLYIANNPFKDWSLERELVIGAAALLIFPAMLVLFFFGKASSSLCFTAGGI